jgi:hypothetical protein
MMRERMRQEPWMRSRSDFTGLLFYKVQNR